MKRVSVARKAQLLRDVRQAEANIEVGRCGKINKIFFLVIDHKALHVLGTVYDRSFQKGLVGLGLVTDRICYGL